MLNARGSFLVTAYTCPMRKPWTFTAVGRSKQVLGAFCPEATILLYHRDRDWTKGLKHARTPNYRPSTPVPGNWTATRWDRWLDYLTTKTPNGRLRRRVFETRSSAAQALGNQGKPLLKPLISTDPRTAIVLCNTRSSIKVLGTAAGCWNGPCSWPWSCSFGRSSPCWGHCWHDAEPDPLRRPGPPAGCPDHVRYGRRLSHDMHLHLNGAFQGNERRWVTRV